jgi:hypothetical protein
VKRFVEELVGDRSRILHGTWSTLNDTLEAGREGLQNFVIDMLRKYALALGEYVCSGNPTDNHTAFLTFVEGRRAKS